MPDEIILGRRARLAADVIRKLDTTAHFTPANRGRAFVTDKMGLTRHHEPTGRVYGAWLGEGNTVGSTPSATAVAHAISEGHGNCDLKAEAAYTIIRNRHPIGFPDTKILRVGIKGHAFCILCSNDIRTTQGTACQIDHFGPEAVVVDGWQSDFYAPNLLRKLGPVPGPERLVWRRRVGSQPITINRVHAFSLR